MNDEIPKDQHPKTKDSLPKTFIMKNNSLFSDDLLWDYADGFLDAAEHQRVTEGLRDQPEAQSRLADILAEKKSFAALPLEIPKPDFADRVMVAWAMEQMHAQSALSPEKGRDWMVLIISGVFGLSLLLPLVMLLVALSNGVAPTLLADYTLPNVPSVDWAGILGHPAVYYSVGLALTFFSLRLLDKYLQQKKTLQLA